MQHFLQVPDVQQSRHNFYDNFAMRNKQPVWYSMSAGLINNIENKSLIAIFTYVPGFTKKDLNVLMRVSKRFNELARSDEFWLQMNVENSEHWLNTFWFGLSEVDNENDMWNRIREESGLPIVNMLK